MSPNQCDPEDLSTIVDGCFLVQFPEHPDNLGVRRWKQKRMNYDDVIAELARLTELTCYHETELLRLHVETKRLERRLELTTTAALMALSGVLAIFVQRWLGWL